MIFLYHCKLLLQAIFPFFSALAESALCFPILKASFDLIPLISVTDKTLTITWEELTPL
jgi:hypothetical protein